MDFAILMIFFLVFEYIADFIAQSRYTAINKSSKFEVLQDHVFTIMGGVGIGMAIAFTIVWGSLSGLIGGAFFAFFYSIIHGVQDWYIWKLYKGCVIERFMKSVKVGEELDILKRLKAFHDNKEYAEDKLFYDFIGADRTLHIITAVILILIFI